MFSLFWGIIYSLNCALHPYVHVYISDKFRQSIKVKINYINQNNIKKANRHYQVELMHACWRNSTTFGYNFYKLQLVLKTTMYIEELQLNIYNHIYMEGKYSSLIMIDLQIKRTSQIFPFNKQNRNKIAVRMLWIW